MIGIVNFDWKTSGLLVMQVIYTSFDAILGYIQIMKQKKLRSPAMLKREDAGGGVEGRWYGGDHLGKRSGCCLEKGGGEWGKLGV